MSTSDADSDVSWGPINSDEEETKLKKQLAAIQLPTQEALPTEVFEFSMAQFDEIDDKDIPGMFIANLHELFAFTAEVILDRFNKWDTGVLLELRETLCGHCVARFSQLAGKRIVKRQAGSRDKIVSDVFALGISLFNGKQDGGLDTIFKAKPVKAKSHSISELDDFSPSVNHDVLVPNAQLKAINDQLTNLNAKVNSIDSATNEILNSLNLVNDQVQKLTERVHRLESSENKTTDALCATKEHLEICERQVEDVRNKCLSNTGQLDLLEKRDKMYKETVEKLSASNKKHELKSGEIEKSLSGVAASILSCQNDLMAIKSEQQAMKLAMDTPGSTLTIPFNPDNTIVVTNLRKGHNENLREICRSLIGCIDNSLVGSIENVCRVGDQGGRAGIIKIQLPNLETKLTVLRGRHRLETSRYFSRVHIRSSQSHETRLVEQNFRRLFDEVPALSDRLMVASNGRVLSRNSGHAPNNTRPSHYGPNSSRGSYSRTENHGQNSSQGPNHRQNSAYTSNEQTASHGPQHRQNNGYTSSEQNASRGSNRQNYGHTSNGQNSSQGSNFHQNYSAWYPADEYGGHTQQFDEQAHVPTQSIRGYPGQQNYQSDFPELGNQLYR